MRDIKFRGIVIGSDNFVFGHFYESEGDSFVCSEDHSDGADTYYNDYVNPNTVGQYTGLKDKNGVEIYEGDIYESGGNYYLISYNSGAFCGGLLNMNSAPLGWNLEVGDYEYTGEMTKKLDLDYINIVGNIHQDKNLLNK